MSDYTDRISPNSFGITTYLTELQSGKYQVPTFQREVVWERDRVKRLWDSIYKFYPLGSMLVWLTDTKLQLHREIGGHIIDDNVARNEYRYLLDGQQRTTSLLTSMYGGSIKDRENADPHLYVDLSIEASQEVEDDSWRNRFLFWDEIDDRNGELRRNLGRQKRFNEGLIVKLSDVSDHYQDLEENLEELNYTYRSTPRTQLRHIRQVLDNYKLSFIVLRQIEVAEVCQIFERVNQAGQPLNMFDIVVAKTFRPEEDDKPGFYLRGLFEQFRHDLEISGSQYSTIDHMTILQIVATLVREEIPDAGIQNITDQYLNLLRTEHIEEIWDDAQLAIMRTYDFLENHLRLPGPTLIPYRYFYLTLSSYFFRNQEPDYRLLRQYFWYYSFHNEDLLRNTTHLRDHVTRFRNARSGETFGFTRFLIDRDRLRNATYTARGRLSRAILSFYATREPRDWKHPDRSVLTSVYYALSDRPNLHHIFPMDFCEKHLDADNARYADSLLNIAYLTQITNQQISNRNPLDYMRKFPGESFHEIQSNHLLPDNLADWVERGSLPPDALNEFVETRMDILLERLRDEMLDMPFEVIDTAATPFENNLSELVSAELE